MRIIPLIACFCLLISITSVLAEEYIFDSQLYGVEELEADVMIENTIHHTGTVSEIEASLFYYPRPAKTQDVFNVKTNPSARERNDALVYTFTNPSSPSHFLYSSTVHTQHNRPKILSPVPYPYEYIPPEVQRYLNDEEIIKITPEIERLAAELISGERDAVRAAFTIGRWVKDNIEYDLNTVTAEASQPSDWVLEQRTGVCDELTSLFIAMLRSQGIPARFISGVAYTNLASLDTLWGPHGWAEVWFPGEGWVPYDVTYGQYGYVDATHIIFTTTEDARTDAAAYVMRSRGGNMQPEPLNREVTLKSKGLLLGEDLRVTVTPALESVGFGSANRIDVHVENRRNYYVSTELFLAKTTNLQTGDYSESILLGPREERDVHWIVTIDEDLRQGYTYTFPVAIYTNRNTSHLTQFTATQRGVVVDEEDLLIEEVPPDERLPERLTCEYPKTVRVGESFSATCTYPKPVRICIEKCSDETTIFTEQFRYDTVGARSIVATAEQNGKEAQHVMTIIVEDDPSLTLWVEAPETLLYGEAQAIIIHLNRTSTAIPEDVTLTVSHPLFVNSWEFPRIDAPGTAEISIAGSQLASGENEITFSATYQSGGQERTAQATATVTPIPETFGQRFWLWMNRVSTWLAT